MGFDVVKFVSRHNVHGVFTENMLVGQQLVPCVAACALVFLGKTSAAGRVSVVAVVLRGVVLVLDVGSQRSAQLEVSEFYSQMSSQVDIIACHVVVVIKKGGDAVAVVLRTCRP